MKSRKYAEFFGLTAFAAVLLVLYVNYGPQASVQTAPRPAAASSLSTESAAASAEQVDPFGIDTSAVRVIRRRVQRHETFADLLTEHGVPYARMLSLAKAARPTLDVRLLKAGKRYRLYKGEQYGALRYLVYQRDPVHYVVFDLTGDGRVYAEERSVTLKRRKAQGVIEHSLYQTLDEAGASPELAFKLARVFAWQIDFFRIQEGDRFEVIYQERRVGGEPVGIGKILAARFRHDGENFYGFYFEQNGHGEYFNEEGESLRKELLKAPLQFTRISSRYQKRRFHPILKRWEAHLGTDYAAPTGTPVYSVGDGTVLEAEYTRYNGNWVKIRHNSVYTTGYLHLSKIAAGIDPGVEVEQGELIGFVGSTGLATGPHLCYRFWKNGRQVDPYKQELPPSEPVAPDYRMAYSRVLSTFMPRVAPTPPPASGPLLAAKEHKPIFARPLLPGLQAVN